MPIIVVLWFGLQGLRWKSKSFNEETWRSTLDLRQEGRHGKLVCCFFSYALETYIATESCFLLSSYEMVFCGVQISCHFEVVERWQAAQMMRASQGHGRALCSSRPSFISCVCVSLLLLSLSLSRSLSLVSMLLWKIYLHKRGRIDEAPGKENNPNSIGKVFQNSQDTCNCQMQIPRRKCPTTM